jgi:hypothetical protein
MNKRKIAGASQILADSALMTPGLAYMTLGVSSSILALVLCVAPTVAFAVLRRTPRIRKKLYAKLARALLLLLTADAASIFVVAVYGWRPALLLVPLAFYAAVFRFRSAAFLKWDPLHCLAVPFFVLFCLSVAGDSAPSAVECGRVARQKGICFLVDAVDWRYTGLIRNFMAIDGTPKILFYSRRGITSHGNKYTLDCLDAATGARVSWLSRGEVLALRRFPDNGDVYAVVVDNPPNVGRGVSATDLVRFSVDGVVKRRTPLPHPRDTYYLADIQPYGRTLLILIENFSYIYHPDQDAITELGLPSPAWSLIVRGHDVYGTWSNDILVKAGRPSLFKYDLAERRSVATTSGGVFGYFDIKWLDDTNLFVVNDPWSGGGVMFDADLNRIRDVPIPRGARNFAVDQRGKLLFAPNFFTGEMRVVNLERNTVLKKTYLVGKGTRTVKAADDGTILIANGCGIVQVDPASLDLSSDP